MPSAARFPSRVFVLLIIASLLALSAPTLAQTTSSSSASQPASTTAASIFPAASPWKYYGCYNETTLAPGGGGARALNGGVDETLDNMTVPLCLAFCKSNAYTLAGIEYTKECYCANFLDALSNQLPNASCDLPCAGNSSQLCGGNLALTIYQVNTTASTTKGSGVKSAREAPVSSILALGIAIAVCLYLA